MEREPIGIDKTFDALPYINITEFARYIGINPALMRRYTCGESIPSEKQRTRIREGLDTIANEIKKYTL